MDITLSIHLAEDQTTYIVYDKVGIRVWIRFSLRLERKARLDIEVVLSTHEDICQLSIYLIINAREVCFQLLHFKCADIAYQHRSNC